MLAPPSPPSSSRRILHLQPPSPPASPAFAHYRPAAAYTFHPYSPPASPPLPEHVRPPALSTKRAPRLAAPFPTFLYANEPPPVTARNKQRVRPSAAQLADLKAVYAATAHPSREEREALGRRIGMRYQSVTNWFQNQRSTAKKRGPAMAHHHHEHDAPTPPPPPPMPRPPHRTDPVRDIIAQASTRPTLHSPLPLPLSGAAILPTPPPHTPLLSAFQVARAPSPAPAPSPTPPKPADRNKRSRPTPPQLAALRALHAATPSPSIEERIRVGGAIGMELGKVTNWFRNLRQTARKKERRALAEEAAAGAGRKRALPLSDDAEGRARKRARREEGAEGGGFDDDAVSSTGGSEAHDEEDEEEEGLESSELGTESDAAHEAVTPEPPLVPAPPAKAPRPAASVDDALLLLALHDARS